MQFPIQFLAARATICLGYELIGLLFPLFLERPTSGAFEVLFQLPGNGFGAVILEPFGLTYFSNPSKESTMRDSVSAGVIKLCAEVEISAVAGLDKGTSGTSVLTS